MDRLHQEPLKNPSLWLKLVVLLFNLIITLFWLIFDNLPLFCCDQMNIFYHTVPGYSVILLGVTATFLLEPLEPLTHRLLLLTGSCLYALTGVLGIINYFVFKDFHTSGLFVALICLFNCVLMIADFVLLESSFPLERVDDTSCEKSFTFSNIEFVESSESEDENKQLSTKHFEY